MAVSRGFTFKLQAIGLVRFIVNATQHFYLCCRDPRWWRQVGPARVGFEICPG
jgi:hypothetical protein